MTGPDRAVEARRMALQSTAELWRGLDVIDAALRHGRFTEARDTLTALRALVKITDAAVIDVCRTAPTQRPTVPRGQHLTVLGCTVSVWPTDVFSAAGASGALLSLDMRQPGDGRHGEVLLSSADRAAIRELLR